MTNQSDQTISLTDLLALSEDARWGRPADALEKTAAAAPQLERLADAMEIADRSVRELHRHRPAR
ncbi:hypothetical protein BF49_4713 [Bradyrhizobium sp.]|nr:hypothetical protein BF49_4713 [Bradyrhizobium sp.]